MAKLIESIGRWAISNNVEGIIMAVIITTVISFCVYDFKTSKVKRG